MNEEHLRHWLAMHCPEQAASEIWNHWVDDDTQQKQEFFELHGVQPTLEMARYVWADRMLAASCVHLIEAHMPS